MCDGLKTSCTRPIGTPNICPAVVKVTYSVSLRVVHAVPGCSCHPMKIGTLLLERRHQSSSVELGDEIVEDPAARPRSAVLGGHHGGERDDRDRGGRRLCAHRLGELQRKPSMSGISMSVTTRSIRVSDFSAASAAAAAAAATT